MCFIIDKCIFCLSQVRFSRKQTLKKIFMQEIHWGILNTYKKVKKKQD